METAGGLGAGLREDEDMTGEESRFENSDPDLPPMSRRGVISLLLVGV